MTPTPKRPGELTLPKLVESITDTEGKFASTNPQTIAIMKSAFETRELVFVDFDTVRRHGYVTAIQDVAYDPLIVGGPTVTKFTIRWHGKPMVEKVHRSELRRSKRIRHNGGR